MLSEAKVWTSGVYSYHDIPCHHEPVAVGACAALSGFRSGFS